MKIRKLVFLGVVLLILATGLGAVGFCADEKAITEGQPVVTATFFDSDLKEALKEVSVQTGVNIAIDEAVKGLITLELKNVPLEKALRMMLISGGFSFHKVDDFYVVGLADIRNPVFPSLCDTQIYCFQNITAQSAKALLPAFYEPYVKFTENSSAVNNGSDIRSDVAENGSATVNAPPELMEKIIADLEKMDGQRRQIRIKALVTEIRNEVLKSWGMNLMNIDFNATGKGTRTLALDLVAGTLSGEGDASFGHFSTTLNALVNEKKATIHADPVLMVTEGKSGGLFIGEKRTLILYSTGTSSTSSSTENVEAGVTLNVTPRIIGGQIELTVAQKVSDFDDNTTDQIIVKSREYSSTVRFLPGQTVMVAGLTNKTANDTTVKTPILGDIPLLGYLFKQKSKVKEDSEILVFLTAEVVKE
jgi:Type II secretory pathway, component HofQ